MTIQQQIDNAREHLRGSKWKVRPSGEPITAEDIEFEVYSYKALMSAAIRSSVSSRSLNQYYKALKDDGFVVLDNKKCPVAGDIATLEELHLRHGMAPKLARAYQQ
tara:strand:+ start:85 stop:402 length:318 start_codon:yes stop_codon:yes gene_type:complete